MGQVVYLREYRRVLRKQYIKKNRARLDKFIARFVSQTLPIAFSRISDHYIHLQRENQATAWDYTDLRDIVHEAIAEAYGKELKQALLKEFWYDAQLLPFDDMLDRCVSSYIMGRGQTYAKIAP